MSNIELDPRYATVAFWLSDGTTARKRMEIPLNSDSIDWVANYIKRNPMIQVDSLDIKSMGDLAIISSQIVAFVVNP